jgi:predicted house-cleaning NTP pyrophosphatase (Maf/HAM1 superfamily)
MKKKILILFLIIKSSISFSQGYNEDKTSMTNFLKRMYTSAPFEGVKVVEDYDNKYFISVISLEKAKYTSQSIMMRVAQVKAQSQANTFFNGSTISSDFIIKTTEEKTKGATDSKSTVETIETIKENSIGFVKAMEILTNFNIEDGKRMVFIYFKELEAKK